MNVTDSPFKRSSGKGAVYNRRWFLVRACAAYAAPVVAQELLGEEGDGFAKKADQATNQTFIYVVDDQPDLLLFYSEILEDAGFRVQTFADRRKAVAAFLKKDPKPSLIITDFVGTPISAEAFIQECRAALPQLKVLMVTGYAELTERSVWETGTKPDLILAKPCDSQALVSAICALLDPRPQPPRNLRLAVP